MKKTIALLLLLSLCGCETLGMRRGVNNEDRSKLRNVAVVSLLGRTFNNIHVGTTVFTNEDSSFPVDWNIDAVASNAVAAGLQGKYYVGIMSPGIEVLSQVEQDSQHIDSVIDLFTDYKRPDYDRLFDTAAANGYDTIIFILPTSWESNHFFKPGYGLYQQNMMGLTDPSCVYGLFVVAAYDAHTKKQLGWEWGFDSMWKGVCTFDENLKYKPASQYTPEELEDLHQRTIKTVTDGVNYGLKGLKL